MSRISQMDLQSEPFAATGNISAPGVENQLGRPEMEPFAVLVREAVQNSWDAKIDGASSIQFRIDLVTLDDAQSQFLRNTVFGQRPPRLDLGPELERDPLRLLILSDRGTQGLGGPTRADHTSGERHPDFADFLRNVGQPPDTEYGGGTYGYGKAAFYRVSRARTICVHTRCLEPSQETERRFMAAGLGHPFGKSEGGEQKKYTGRHWWGRQDGDVVEPLLGDDADEAARRLGFPGYPNGTTGTSVAVVAPNLRDRSPEDAARFMADNVLWYFWPKMLEGTPCMIDFEIHCGNQKIDLPDPESYPPLQGFVQAMKDYRSHKAGDAESSPAGHVQQANCKKPKKPLGMISLRKFPRRKRAFLSQEEDWKHLPFEDGASRHVALLRHPEFVVRYQKGPQLEDDVIEYAGIFRAFKKMDRLYAKSEPPAHDDWVPDNLEGHDATYVRTTFRRIDEALKSFVQPMEVGRNDEPGLQLPLGGFSEAMAELIPGTAEGGGEIPHPHDGQTTDPSPGNGNGNGSAGPKPGDNLGRSKVHPETAEMRYEDSGRIAVIPFTVDHPAEATGSSVTAEFGVSIEEGSGKERTPPKGEEEPRVRRWVDPDGNILEGDTIEVSADQAGTWRLEIDLPSEAVSEVALSAQPYTN